MMQMGSDGGNPGMHGVHAGPGSSYLKRTGTDNFVESAEDNWDQASAESEPEDFSKYEEREEFIFENGARYKGQWKEAVRHGKGI